MKNDKFDVGFIEDAVMVLSNLICAENHALNTFQETKNEQWLRVASAIRRDRSVLLSKLTKEENGEQYCFNKHILSASLGLKELANRMLEENNESYAKELLENALSLEKLFIMLNDTGGENV